MSARLARATRAGTIALAWLVAASTALAESPAPSQAAIGDPRGGQAAGFAGNPGFAILIVVLIAVVAIAGTLAWVRATGGPGGRHADAGANPNESSRR